MLNSKLELIQLFYSGYFLLHDTFRHFYMHITSATICCVLCLIKVKRRLDRAQRRAAKIVLKTKDSDLKWLPLSMRRDMHTINLTFKCLKGSPPMFFKDYFKVFRTIHNTRGSGHNLLLPKVRTETARKSFYFNGSKLFNNISSEMKDSKSVAIFKTRILELYI